MTKACSFILLLCFAVAHSLHAQSLEVLKQSLQKMNAVKSVRYQNRYINKNPFSAADTSRGTRQTTLLFNNAGTITGMDSYNNTPEGKNKFREVYTADSLYSISLADTLYSASFVKDGKIWSEWNNAKEVLNTVINSKKPIIQQKDSIVNKIICYNFFIKISDTIIDKSRSYAQYQILIDKRALLPVKIKQIAEGNAKKGDYDLGKIQIYQENYYSGYVVNAAVKPGEFAFNKDGFSLQNTAMLLNGEQIPNIKVTSLAGTPLKADEFKNKLMLIELGSTTCPANALANPMLNRLQGKYSKSGVLVFGIYCDDTAQQITKYLQGNNLRFPIYTAGKKQKRALKTVGTPGFYLVDKSGKILLTSNGYNDTLENEISELIDKQLK